MIKDELLGQLRKLREGQLDHQQRAVLLREIAAAQELSSDLSRMLESENDEYFKIELLQIIGATQDAAYADAILNVLRSDQRPKVRQTAATSLGKVGGEQSFATLVNLLDDPSPNVRLGAVYGLTTLGDQSAVKHLASKLEDNEPVRVWWPSPKAGGYRVGKESALAIDALTGQKFKGDKVKIGNWIEQNELGPH